MQGDAFVFQGPPKSFDKDIVEEAAFAVHGNTEAVPPQTVRPSEGCDLRTLVGIHDLRGAKPVDRLIQCLVPLPGRRFAKQICREGQKSASSALEMRQAKTLRVCQSMMATK